MSFEDPEPNGEVEQDSIMELDYRNLNVHIEMCVWVPMYKCVSVCAAKSTFVVCVCIYIFHY